MISYSNIIYKLSRFYEYYKPATLNLKLMRGQRYLLINCTFIFGIHWILKKNILVIQNYRISAYTLCIWRNLQSSHCLVVEINWLTSVSLSVKHIFIKLFFTVPYEPKTLIINQQLNVLHVLGQPSIRGYLCFTYIKHILF